MTSSPGFTSANKKEAIEPIAPKLTKTSLLGLISLPNL